MLVSVVTPCVPEHIALVARAAASVERQSVPCEHVVVVDEARHGAGWARNVGFAQSTGQFVVWLDADDELEPRAVETLLRAYRPGRYCYSDWYEDGVTVQSPDPEIAWLAGTFHLVTALVPRRLVEQVGGFDASLPGAEDCEFYLHARARGWCGTRVGAPLVHYHGDGLRSRAFRSHPEHDGIRGGIVARYKETLMGCNCGGQTPPMTFGERQPGDVLARVLYAPSAQIIGGRYYQRPFFLGAEMWVAREHVAARPDLWEMIADPEAEAAALDQVLALASEALTS